MFDDFVTQIQSDEIAAILGLEDECLESYE